jgi:hypothetical protein
VKRRDVIRRIRDEARRQEVGWAIEREGRNHTLYRLGAIMIPIPRHAELDDHVAEEVFKECEAELGERWWRK